MGIDVSPLILGHYGLDRNGNRLDDQPQQQEQTGRRLNFRKKKKKRKAKRSLPVIQFWAAQFDRKFAILAWILSIGLILASIVYLLSLSIDENLATSWIFAWFWTMIQVIFLNQALKILFIAFMIPWIKK